MPICMVTMETKHSPPIQHEVIHAATEALGSGSAGGVGCPANKQCARCDGEWGECEGTHRVPVYHQSEAVVCMYVCMYVCMLAPTSL